MNALSVRPGERYVAHDAHVVACARAAGAQELATLDRRDFERLDLGDLRLVAP